MRGKIIFCTLMVCVFFGTWVQAGPPVPVISTEDAAEAAVPVIMYHLVTERQKFVGKYGITPAQLEADLLCLAEGGYTTVVMADLIAFVQDGIPLPAKPIVLTFDDGNMGDFTYVLPLLEKYDARAVFSIIGEVTDRYTAEKNAGPAGKFPNLTWDEVKILHDSGRAEIQSHGYDLHGRRGAGIRSGESDTAYHTRLKEDLQRLQSRVITELGFTPTTFTYPLGIISPGAQAVLEELGFSASLSCREGMNYLKQGDARTLFRLKRSNRPAAKPICVLLEAIE